MELREDWQRTSDLSSERGMGDPFAAAVRWSRMPMVFVDAKKIDLPIMYANDAFCRLTGYDISEIVGRNCRFLQGPDTDVNAIVAIRQSIESQTPIGIDVLNYRKDGSTFWNAVYISPVFNEAGELLYYFSSQFDATERLKIAQSVAARKVELEAEVGSRTAEMRTMMRALEKTVEEKTLLVHEIDHRVKNNLQTISTLISLQLRSLTDPEVRAALQVLQQRVDALGAVQRRLANTGTVGTFDLAQLVHDLAPDISTGYARGDISIVFDVEAAALPSALATPVSLILNELMTNAFRHAWADDQSGQLKISTHVVNREAVLAVQDDGQGMPPDGQLGRISGLKLVEALVRQVRGTIRRPASAAGTHIRIGIPLS